MAGKFPEAGSPDEASAPRLGCQLHVEIDGDGPPIALAHGFAGSARNFGPQARALRARYRAIRYDARGHARSEAPTDPAAYTPETFVIDLGRALERAGATHAVVGGLSMGAATALRFALRYPERTRALVLAAFPAGADTPGGFAAVAGRFADAIEREGVEAAGERFVWGPASGLDANAARFVRQGFLEHPAHGLAHTLRGVLAVQPSVAAMAPELRGLACPTLVLVGAEDRTSLAPSHALAEALPNSRLVVIPDAGHVVNLAAPDAFNRAVLDLLDRLPAAP
jgi:pimeloyl-ACP methyl ester carboxylesterase